jgi:hypothetical protein
MVGHDRDFCQVIKIKFVFLHLTDGSELLTTVHPRWPPLVVTRVPAVCLIEERERKYGERERTPVRKRRRERGKESEKIQQRNYREIAR